MLPGMMLRPSLSAIPLPTLRWLAASGAMLALALAASAWRVGIDRQTHDFATSIASLHQQLNAGSAEWAASAPERDFAQGLPEASAIDAIIRELQRSSAEVGTAFASVSSTPHAATPQTLGRTELSVSLRGAYPKLKTVLAQTLDRFPNLVVQRLTLRRMTAPVDLEAHVDLVLLVRPVAAASGAGG